jgi:hypothetical protein
MTTPWSVSWVTAFLDVPPGLRDEVVRFWSAVTASTESPPRGEEGEFVSLLPEQGDPFLAVQRTGTAGTEPTGPSVHLDLHVRSPSEAADRAVASGATAVHRSPHGYVVLRSPGGLVHCFVGDGRHVRPEPVRWPRGHESLLDQVCLDIPPGVYDAECRYWSGLTGWRLRRSASRPEFHHLERPVGVPLRFLLQRLDADGPDASDGTDASEGTVTPVTAHLDLACDDRDAEVARHVSLGATVVGDPGGGWTVLRDPAGSVYCVTDRDPHAG